MEFKLFTEPKFHDVAWYKDRDQADHIHESGHRERLIEAVEQVEKLRIGMNIDMSVSDIGCGNGGLLKTLRERSHDPDMKCWGYDLCPANVKHAQEVYGVRAELKDFTNPDDETVEYGGIVALTEVLEHLVDPHGLVERLYWTHDRNLSRRPQFIVASSPALETPNNHYEYHIWAWTGDSYPKMFERAGWKIDRAYVLGCVNTQFVVAHR